MWWNGPNSWPKTGRAKGVPAVAARTPARRIEFTAALPPSVNGRYDYFEAADPARHKRRRIILNQRTLDYQEAVGWEALQVALALPTWPAPPFRLDVWLLVADAQRSVEPDADNALKALCDGLIGGLSRDGAKLNDRDIMELHVYKRRGAERSCCRVRLSWGEDALTRDAA
jgi:Holliday junction resolvase RusA-like endonuclease